MSKAKRYTLETLLPLNVSYDSDHGLTQEDVDMVNSLVEVIKSTRSKHTPKIGDRVVYTQKGGEYHPHGLIEKKHEDKFYVCLDPFIPFVWESDTTIKVDVSGGPFYHADADKFKFIGWTEADFKEWGHCGATANGTVRFKAKVPLWAYSEPNPLYGDFTTKDWKKITCRKRFSITAFTKSSFVAATIRTLQFLSSLAPTGRYFFSCITRNNICCISYGRLPTSSRNNVPPFASWKYPTLFASAPVNAPLICPKNAD